MSAERTWDLVVVGGGPAGVMASWTAAQAGLRVALLDHKPLARIGDKVCGDALITKFLIRSLPAHVAQAVLPQGDEAEDIITRVELGFPSGKSLNLPLTRLPLVTVDRLRYGQRLLTDAIATGVQVFDRHAVSEPVIERERVVGVRVQVRGRDESVVFRAPVVIDASGATGVIRRTIPRSLAPAIARDMARPGEVGVTFREILRTPRPHGLKGTIVVLYPPNLPPPGYLWYFSRGEDLVNVGIGYRDATVAPHTRARDLYRQALEADGRLGQAEVVDSRGATLPARRPLDSNVAPGLLIAGDAGFHADALTGEGHGTALLAGFWAGQTAVEAHRWGDFSEAGLWSYNLKCMRHFGQAFAARCLWSRAIEKFTPADFDFIHALVDERRIAEAFEQNEFIERAAFAPAFLVSLLWRAWRARHIPATGFIRRFLRVSRQVQIIRHQYDRYPAEPAGLAAWVDRTNQLVTLVW